MIAPVAFEDLTFPEQYLFDWSDNESLKWMSVGSQYFTTDNGVSYGAAAAFGPDMGNSVAKYAGGALGLDGKIYALGHLQDNWVAIDTFTDTITSSSYSPNDPSSNAIAYSPFTNCVYADSDNGIVKIDTSAGTYSAVAYPFSGQATVLGIAHDGRRIFFHGFAASKQMYYYDILTDTITSTGVTWTGDRVTGCLSWNNKFYMGGGGGSTNFLVYDVDANSATTITGGASIGADQYRNFIQYFDGYLYTFGGFGANRIKRVNPVTNEVIDVYTMPATNYNLNDYTIGADGKIYAVGQSSTMVIFDPRDNSFSTASLPYNSYEGITMGARGDLYLIPWNANYFTKVPIQNNGRVLSPIQEYNGIISRHQAS